MPALDSIIFDLDGTLWDTCPACAIGWNNVIKRHGIRFAEISADHVRSVAGRPHEHCIRQVFSGLPENVIQILIAETAIEDNRIVAELGGELYHGVADGLKNLSENYPLFIVSNCQTGYIETFLNWSGFQSMFKDYECWGRTGLSKAENIRQVITRNSLQAPLYVGDTQGDADAARANGIAFAHTRYGFGKVDRADVYAHSFAELCAHISIFHYLR